GCGVLASALCMDKDRAHKLAQAAGVAIPQSTVLERWMGVTVALAEGETLGYPLFVKPVRAGSSYGITKVMERGQLSAALELAFQYDDQIIMEEAVPGFEVGCAVLGNETLTVGEPDEIELAGGFFNFTEKYTLETSTIHVPARVTAEQREQIKASAKRIYRALGCQGFARVDQFLTTEGRLVFNEVNTIPGFTAHSRYPNMMKAAGMSFEQVISALIELAVKR
ncbi:MAG: ATP-grasp domain-containing protein, partial [Dysosmobacter sp.]|nr:ATP-grasp domain-containing protein [Dysosmobacter sp.]